MTGGRVVILGEIGRNFAAAMSGGLAFLRNELDFFLLTKINKVIIICKKFYSILILYLTTI